jgi:succinyl-diaminopimelate desuccinylase
LSDPARLIDPLPLAQALIRCPSLTPHDAGALDKLIEALSALGFSCHDLSFGAVRNLYARRGAAKPVFGFAGHTDVVPPGQGWSVDPFAATVIDGTLFGRGAVDMKGAIAAFVAALARLGADHRGSIALLITGDEEGRATEGTVKILDWMKAKGEKLDACLVGEPTSPKKLGEAMKVGRRGSLNGRLTVKGAQGHAAYPHLADNPLPRLVRMLKALIDDPLDDGSAHFEPSSVALTTIDVGNPVTNLTPAQATAGFNIRFNDLHSGAAIERRLRRLFDAIGRDWDLAVELSGESFVTLPGPLTQAVAGAAREVLGLDPELSTSGGTSDARFIKDHCPVVEFGLAGATMHKADERVAVADLDRLADVYRAVIERALAP